MAIPCGSSRLLIPLACLALVPCAPLASAQTLTVTETSDAGSGSLREAITQADADPDADRIEFGLEPDDPIIALDAELPAVDDDDLDIVGVQGNPTVQAASSEVLIRVDGQRLTFEEVELSGSDASIQLSNDGILVFDRSQTDSTVGLNIEGAGEVRKDGEFTLTLEGNNTYTGGTGVLDGRLRGSTASISGDVDVAAGAELEIATPLNSGDPDTASFGDVISGGGRLLKTGEGTLTLTGSSTYQGGTAIEAGTLAAETSTLPDGGDVSIDAGARLRFDQGSDATFSGDLSGGGEMIKAGAGRLTLTGSSSLAGTTTVSAGELVVSSGSLAGPSLIEAGSTLVFEQMADGTYAGSVMGAGQLVKDGAGALTLTGASSHTGGTSVLGGTLVGDVDALQAAIDVSGGASLEFAQTADGTFAGAITGAGDVRKTGAGSLTWTQDQAFLGTTHVDVGALRLSGVTLSGDVSVAAGATLAGSGTLGALTLSGAIAPGGLLTSSAAVLNPGSLLQVDVQADGTADQLRVNGTTTYAGGEVAVNPAPGDYSAGVSYTILDTDVASGGVAPTPIDDLVFLDLSTMIDGGGDLVLTVQGASNSFSGFARTPNQVAVALALDSIDPAELPPGIGTVTESQISTILEQAAGDEVASFTHSRVAGALRSARALTTRLTLARRELRLDRREYMAGVERSRSSRGGTVVAPGTRAAELPPVAAAPGAPRWSAWFSAEGTRGEIEESGSKDLDYSGGGALVGLDVTLPSGWSIGLAGGVGRTDMDVDGPSSGDSTSYEGSVYLSRIDRRFGLTLAARLARSEMEMKRSVVLPGQTLRARGEFDGTEIGGMLATELLLAASDFWELEGVSSLVYDRVDRDSFREKGAGPFSLHVQSEAFDSLVSVIGLRLAIAGGAPDALAFPSLYIGWEREWADLDPRVRASIGGGTSIPFEVEAPEQSRNRGLLRVGWETTLFESVAASLYYDARLGTDFIEHGLLLGAHWAF